MTHEIEPGDFVKARFWPGETIWAEVTAIHGRALDGRLANLSITGLPPGSAVSCGTDEVIEHMKPSELGG